MFAYHAAWSQLASAGACCPVGVPRLHQHKLPGSATVNVKRLLPPRQSRGTSLGNAPATGRAETPLAARVASGSGQVQTPSGPFKRTRKGVPLSGSCRRTHERERRMHVQRRNFLLSATLLAAAATPSFGQVEAPTIRPDSGTQRAVSIRISPVYGDTHIGPVSSRLPRDLVRSQQVART
jgi:hypothetical protein